ncbi:MAG: glycine zipper 2TM domain-containing protein [Sphingomonas bacterium]
MRIGFVPAIFAAAMLTAPVAFPASADAQRRDHRWQGDRNGWDASRAYHPGRYKERRLNRNDRIYRGRDGRYYCRRNDGTTGLVVGAVAGGLLGNVIGGDTLGTLVGGAGGALLGRSIDRGQVRCR